MATRQTFMDLVAAASARGGTGEVVVSRDYAVSEPVLFLKQEGFRIRGAGGYRPILHWTGDADNFLDFANCRDTEISNLVVHVHGRLGNVCHYWRKLQGSVTPTNNRHRSVAVLVQPGGSLHRFASHDTFDTWEAATGIDQNNEFGLYEDVDVDGSTDGIRFLGQQSHGHVLSRCRLNVKNDGVVSSGWFSATDVSGSGLSGAAFHQVAVSAPLHLVRPNFEATRRLLVCEAPGPDGELGQTGDSQAVLIEGGSTRCDQLHPDGALIDLKTLGPLRVVGHQFGSGNQPIPYVRTVYPGVVRFEACDFGSWGSALYWPVRRLDGSDDGESPALGCTFHYVGGQAVYRRVNGDPAVCREYPTGDP